MKIDLNILIDYAYSNLSKEQEKELNVLLVQEEYSLEFTILKSIIDKCKEGFTKDEFINWLDASTDGLKNFSKDVLEKKIENNRLNNVKEKVTYSINQLKIWFDENILFQHPAIQTVRNTASQNDSNSNKFILIDDNFIKISLNENSNAEFQITDTEGNEIFNETLNNDFELNLKSLNLHPGIYLYILSQIAIGTHFGTFEIDANLNPNIKKP